MVGVAEIWLMHNGISMDNKIFALQMFMGCTFELYPFDKCILRDTSIMLRVIR